MEFLILVVVVIVALYIFNLGGVKQHRRNLQDEIEKSLDKNYKPFTDEEKEKMARDFERD